MIAFLNRLAAWRRFLLWPADIGSAHGDGVTPTFIGVILAAVGLVLLFRAPAHHLLALVILCMLLGGSAAIQLPALGGSSVPPAYFALGFLVLRCLLPGTHMPGRWQEAFRSQWPFILFTLYGVIGAIFLPRIFQGAMQVPALRPSAGMNGLFDTETLRPVSSNITTAVYLIGTCLMALTAQVSVRTMDQARSISRTMLWAAWIHLILGVGLMLLSGTAIAEAVLVLRNANYAQLSQQYGDFVRISGIFPEPSSWAEMMFSLFLFSSGLAFIGVYRTTAVVTTLLCGAALLFSTSSSAYLGLAVYFALLAVKLFLDLRRTGWKAVSIIVPVAIAGLAAMLAVALLSPKFADSFVNMVLAMTVDKGASSSALQRNFWSQKALEAFGVSLGLGVGPGSLRSSSLIAAVAGSMGVIGIVCLLATCGSMIRTFVRAPRTEAANLAKVAAGAGLVALVPSLVLAPSPNPGLFFATCLGLAASLRLQSLTRPPEERTREGGR